MNKILFLLFGLFVIQSALAQPLLEISEFGSKSPAMQIKLTGKKQNFSGRNWSGSVRKISGKVNTPYVVGRFRGG